jgi:hypothetical protein
MLGLGAISLDKAFTLVLMGAGVLGAAEIGSSAIIGFRGSRGAAGPPRVCLTFSGSEGHQDYIVKSTQLGPHPVRT